MFYSFSTFGREAEYIVGLYLKSKDWNVYFSKGSRGPSDIVAMKDQLIWLIQIKSSTKIPRIRGYEIQNLIKLSQKINNSYPILSIINPKSCCPVNENSISLGRYFLNFYLLPQWKSIALPQ